MDGLGHSNRLLSFWAPFPSPAVGEPGRSDSAGKSAERDGEAKRAVRATAGSSGGPAGDNEQCPCCRGSLLNAEEAGKPRRRVLLLFFPLRIKATCMFEKDSKLKSSKTCCHASWPIQLTCLWLAS